MSYYMCSTPALKTTGAGQSQWVRYQCDTEELFDAIQLLCLPAAQATCQQPCPTSSVSITETTAASTVTSQPTQAATSAAITKQSTTAAGYSSLIATVFFL
jgi:hypothetical protein